MEEKKILGITEDELERVEEDLDVDDIEDFDLEEAPLFYEIWLLCDNENHEATEFDYLIDDGYTELEEAKKCFDYFTNTGNIAELVETKEITIPAEVKHLRLVLEMCRNAEDSEGTECVDIVEEVEIF